MMTRATRFAVVACLVLVFGFAGILPGSAITIDFEGVADSTPITNQYAGVSFSGATAITSGVTLNEYEYPPVSGQNVVFDDGRSITGTFDAPVDSFGAYFTHNSPVTLRAWDSSENLLGSQTSAYNSNAALSGDPGSTPSEFLSVSFASDIFRFEIVGDEGGSSFIMDDFQFTPASPQPIPDASTLLLGLMSIGACWPWRKLSSR